MPSNVLPLHIKQTFLPIIWIFNEGEGDRIKFRLPFKIFSTLNNYLEILEFFYFKTFFILESFITPLDDEDTSPDEYQIFRAIGKFIWLFLF